MAQYTKGAFSQPSPDHKSHGYLHFPGLPVTFGRGGRLCETAGGSLRRPPDGEAESGVAVAVGEVFAPGGQGGADPDRPLRLQRAIWNRSGEEKRRKSLAELLPLPYGRILPNNGRFSPILDLISWPKVAEIC